MQEAKEAAARRGELRLPLPIGYAYDIDGQVVLLYGRKHAPGIGFRLALPSTSSLPAPRGALYRQVSTTREECGFSAPTAPAVQELNGGRATPARRAVRDFSTWPPPALHMTSTLAGYR